MTPIQTFLVGLAILGLFAWYFATDIPRRKRYVGTALTILLLAFCIEAVMPPSQKIRLGLDLQGGSSFLIRLVKDNPEAEITPSMQEQAVEVIRARIDQYGVSEPVITPQGEDRILVQIPGMDGDKMAQAREQLQRVAKLEFRLVHPQSDSLIPQIERGEAIIPPGYAIETYTDTVKGREVELKLLVRRKADLTGDRVTSARTFYDQRGYGVSLNFDSEGAKKFGELTAAHVNERFAIVLDGVVQSAPVINEPIYGGSAVITGRFTEVEARNLTSVLENPLQTPVVIEEERSVSASLGADSIRNGIYAILIGFGLVLLCVIVYYQLAGLIAFIGLLVNVVLLFGIMSMFNFVLTLPGIAGIVLVIGMAIDANVLIYERIREELAAGTSLKAAIDAGYQKAFSAIWDANVTTLITSAILFGMASGTVKGFAVTLTVGIAASMFSALLVTRNLFSWATALGILKNRLPMLHLISSQHFDFLGKRKVAALLSSALVLICIAAIILRGEKNLGVDFRGGDLLVMEYEGNVSEADVRKSLEAIGQADAVIQKRSTLDQESIVIRSPFDSGQKIADHLIATMPEAKFSLGGLDRVGPAVGRELAINSLIAIAMGMIAIFIYLALRFEISFAVGAIVALLHDIIACVGILALIGHEFSLVLVGAVLTVAGYSINDTIIVFDRIREGIQRGGKRATVEVMNASINETLSRTIITSGLTLLSLVSLYFLGGPVLEDFAIAIITGILVGTYSSIFVASPVVLWWSKMRGTSLKHEIRKTEDQKAAIASASR